MLRRFLSTAANAPQRASGELQEIIFLNKRYPMDGHSNIPARILEKIDAGLLHAPNHPLGILKSRIERALPDFHAFDRLSPVVSCRNNFDRLLVPVDHPSRSTSDTYYINRDLCLRTHTSAHQHDILKEGKHDRFLVFADVYRRDEIDSSHYPVFHQVEGVCTFPAVVNETSLAPSGESPWQPEHRRFDRDQMEMISQDLRLTLSNLVKALFMDEELEVRWVESYFPFTHPSWELEILYRNKWLEVAGCGIIQQQILDEAGRGDRVGWAFGLGLERIAMVLFDIPDIRLFWSQDERFLRQFDSNALMNENIKFKPISKYPAVYKDISFWLPESDSGFHQNHLFEVIRGVAGDLVEDVQLVDEFTHPKTKRMSKCFRVLYRSVDRTLTNLAVNELQDSVLKAVVSELDVTLR
eukprot:Partr_v1_DN28893_c0_g1_i1_m34212 putative Phenylalanyl-trna synthetase